MDKKLPKSIVPEDVLLAYDVPYIFQDTCVKEYVKYQQCLRQNPRLIENAVIHAIPFSNFISKCGRIKEQFSKCQDYREREIFEEMRKIYVENVKLSNEKQ